MATTAVQTVQSAKDLPACWDRSAGDNLFLKQASLAVLEKVNPCEQRYHWAGEDDDCSVVVTYRHRLNILTFGKGSLSLPVTVIGIPCSVSQPGCRFAPHSRDHLIQHLRKIPGSKLVLNTAYKSLPGFTNGKTLPSCRMTVSWDSFDDYLEGLRSHYRYRIKKALSRWEEVRSARIDNPAFDDHLYSLYENVHRRSKYKLEKLSPAFFHEFPSEITVFKHRGRPIAFVQTTSHNDELTFLFAGMDYTESHQLDTYMNVLLTILQKGIEGGYASIDFGQTAEPVKCKLGCRLSPKNLHIAHSNGLLHKVFTGLSGFLSYSYKDQNYRVFKPAAI